eukprot:14694356-Alexandrium_andersonii.AAC.1
MLEVAESSSELLEAAQASARWPLATACQARWPGRAQSGWCSHRRPTPGTAGLAGLTSPVKQLWWPGAAQPHSGSAGP